MAPGDDFIPRDEALKLVERVAESTRREFTAALTTVQVQIGASEKTLSEKIKSAKAWGIAAFVGGQTIAGVAAAYIGPSKAVRTSVQFFHHFV